MPELPEVETVRQGISPHLTQQSVQGVLIREPRLRWPVPSDLPATLTGDTFKKIDRRGKYLLLYTTKGCLISHLGMSGSLYLASPDTPLKKHDHVLIHLQSNQVLRYHDPRRFGSLHWTYDSPFCHTLLQKLGPEPLLPSFDSDYLFSQCSKSQRAIKNLIMDANIVVGVGNIYASEALFLCNIHPAMPANAISLVQCHALVDAIRTLLRAAIVSGGTTLRDFVNPDSQPGYFKQSLQVYGRTGEPCHLCQSTIEVLKIGQRSSCYCPTCQPLVD
tara:strand:- start:923 stop:1747 length:825 start_codon:yes stop_codon:yes gene_type:complete